MSTQDLPLQEQFITNVLAQVGSFVGPITVQKITLVPNRLTHGLRGRVNWLDAPILHGTGMAFAANPMLGHERMEPTLQSSPIWRRWQALFVGIWGDDILLSLVSLHQKGIGQMRSCRERWNGDMETDKVSQYFYRDMVVP
ncbi:hypothetical protein [Limnohabitans planktonicus]|uniref:Uncharacterized protein n=1 Tax=Limnohabitans planktonicus II-D5 TaxID=1293045 RepID=A0A2T7UFZ2_9BURK|nr:hypothetical protein [Limnohabitans planktonicus]PVE43617.1 hypothetical protein H663_006390 [Limnohabitans planktonicus II-D5]